MTIVAICFTRVPSPTQLAAISTWLHVVDVAEPAAPEILSSTRIPSMAEAIVAMGSHAYIVSDSGLHIVDVTDSTNPIMVGSVGVPDQPKDIAVSGSYAFVASMTRGLWVIDVM